MKITYKINNQTLLQSISISLANGRVILFTGVENIGFGLLSGILARLFPVSKNRSPVLITPLIANYAGDLLVEDGELPKAAGYVGVDPDRHLLFATVGEELGIQLKNSDNLAEKLAKFGLDKTFLDRKIASLSGGEKMRVALAIVFAQLHDCYVLHGVIPWLDQAGRELLFQQIRQAKARGVDVIFFEHENAGLESIIDEVFVFDGIGTRSVPLSVYFTELGCRKSKVAFQFSKKNSETILELQKVFLLQHPLAAITRGVPLLNQVSLKIDSHQIYFLLGDNGEGKSTLVQLIFRVFEPKSGVILLQGLPLTKYLRSELNRLIVYVGQFPARQLTLSTFGQYRKLVAGNGLINDLLKKYLNLADNVPVATLSFLQIKILCLLVSLTMDTKLIIFDEPTWGMDYLGSQQLMALLAEITQHLAVALLIISHDQSLAKEFSAKTFRLHHGQISLCN